MSEYPLTWITKDLAVGFAPMSYDDLTAIKRQGIDAIVNLCAEFSDLHEIEESSGFEVYYLPIWDESVPDMDEMEKGLAWLDEAIYLGKKVLVHCRYGIGRTGTLVTAYMIRKGMGLKKASKKLKSTNAKPSTYSQWKLVKKYGKKTGILKEREPSLEMKASVDLSKWFSEYEALQNKIDNDILKNSGNNKIQEKCGNKKSPCCYRYFDLHLIEVVYLNSKMNRHLKSETRSEIIERAVKISQKTRQIEKNIKKRADDSSFNKNSLSIDFNKKKILCPLSEDKGCSLYQFRPISCRVFDLPNHLKKNDLIETMLSDLSKNLFFAFSGKFLKEKDFTFSLADTVSGRFVQKYFHFLANS
ncbi:MAG: dual specificity protein phosphatase family protein [Thermodesulfobacteriota bacterium]|nr:dual specificity protein phosphatase family protein [Thermodesulfobacteriota bacterium]